MRGHGQSASTECPAGTGFEALGKERVLLPYIKANSAGYPAMPNPLGFGHERSQRGGRQLVVLVTLRDSSQVDRSITWLSKGGQQRFPLHKVTMLSSLHSSLPLWSGGSTKGHSIWLRAPLTRDQKIQLSLFTSCVILDKSLAFSLLICKTEIEILGHSSHIRVLRLKIIYVLLNYKALGKCK